MNKKRSRGLTILSVTEIILGAAGIGFATWYAVQGFMLYEPATTNSSVGFCFIFAFMFYVLSLPMFIAGLLTFLLKPSGRILSICCLVLLLPVSIPLIIYLLRNDIKQQFK